MVPDFLEHVADLAVAAFDQSDFEPGIVGFLDLGDEGGSGLHGAGTGLAQQNPLAQFVQALFTGLAGDFHNVFLSDVGRSLHQLTGQIAVVGEQQQAFAGVVEAAHGIDALMHTLDQVHHGGAVLLIADRGDVALGLVEHDVHMAVGSAEELAIDADVVGGGIGLGAECGDDGAVNDDASFGDEFLGFAA